MKCEKAFSYSSNGIMYYRVEKSRDCKAGVTPNLDSLGSTLWKQVLITHLEGFSVKTELIYHLTVHSRVKV